MHVKIFSQLSQGFVKLYGRHRHLGLEAGGVIPSCHSHVLASLFAVFATAWAEQDAHLSDCRDMRNHRSN